MGLECSIKELQHALGEATFARSFGFTIHAIGDGECSIDVPFREGLERPGGIVGGPVFMAAADIAMWLAIKTRLGMADASVTAEMKTNFLGAARKQGFRCNAKVLKFGRRLIYGTAECVDQDGRMLTHSTVTYIRAD